MANGLWRALVILHRYLGIAVGLLMAVWFVSGIVMMYVGFPRLAEAERVRALAPIPWQACCQFGVQLLADDQPIMRAQLESHLGEPALRLLKAAVQQNYCAYAALLDDPLLKDLRKETAFNEVLTAASNCQAVLKENHQ